MPQSKTAIGLKIPKTAETKMMFTVERNACCIGISSIVKSQESDNPRRVQTSEKAYKHPHPSISRTTFSSFINPSNSSFSRTSLATNPEFHLKTRHFFTTPSSTMSYPTPTSSQMAAESFSADTAQKFTAPMEKYPSPTSQDNQFLRYFEDSFFVHLNNSVQQDLSGIQTANEVEAWQSGSKVQQALTPTLDGLPDCFDVDHSQPEQYSAFQQQSQWQTLSSLPVLSSPGTAVRSALANGLADIQPQIQALKVGWNIKPDPEQIAYENSNNPFSDLNQNHYNWNPPFEPIDPTTLQLASELEWWECNFGHLNQDPTEWTATPLPKYEAMPFAHEIISQGLPTSFPTPEYKPKYDSFGRSLPLDHEGVFSSIRPQNTIFSHEVPNLSVPEYPPPTYAAACGFTNQLNINIYNPPQCVEALDMKKEDSVEVAEPSPNQLIRHKGSPPPAYTAIAASIPVQSPQPQNNFYANIILTRSEEDLSRAVKAMFDASDDEWETESEDDEEEKDHKSNEQSPSLLVMSRKNERMRNERMTKMVSVEVQPQNRKRKRDAFTPPGSSSECGSGEENGRWESDSCTCASKRRRLDDNRNSKTSTARLNLQQRMPEPEKKTRTTTTIVKEEKAKATTTTLPRMTMEFQAREEKMCLRGYKGETEVSFCRRAPIYKPGIVKMDKQGRPYFLQY